MAQKKTKRGKKDLKKKLITNVNSPTPTPYNNKTKQLNIIIWLVTNLLIVHRFREIQDRVSMKRRINKWFKMLNLF